MVSLHMLATSTRVHSLHRPLLVYSCTLFACLQSSSCAAGGGGRPGTGGLMRWRSNRVLCHDKLHWVDPSRDDKGAASSDQYPDVRRVSYLLAHLTRQWRVG